MFITKIDTNVIEYTGDNTSNDVLVKERLKLF